MRILLLALSLVTTSAFSQTNKRVIGSDSRQRITARTYQPVHESIGLIITFHGDSIGMCTGTVIGPRHVITAAHCLSHKGKFVDSALYIPAMNGDYFASPSPYGTFKATKLRIPKSYLKSKKTENDLGLMTFSENLPTPALPLGVIPDDIKEITIAGYPGDKTEGTLWEAKGKRHTTLFGGRTNSHEVDTMAGQSGAAVRATISGRETIVAIHTAGVESWLFPDHNLALFLTTDLNKLIRSWTSED